MNIKLLKLLSNNARYSTSELAVMLGTDEQTIKKEIEEMQKSGLICGYKAVIDWEKLDTGAVSAIIELKVSPQADHGFEEIAKRIMVSFIIATWQDFTCSSNHTTRPKSIARIIWDFEF